MTSILYLALIALETLQWQRLNLEFRNKIADQRAQLETIMKTIDGIPLHHDLRNGLKAKISADLKRLHDMELLRDELIVLPTDIRKRIEQICEIEQMSKSAMALFDAACMVQELP